MNNETINKKGGISVETAHIFPVIKKWLYSEKDIFLREIVSNACDAVTKLKRLSSLGKYDGGDERGGGVEGAGDVFIYNTIKWRFIRFMVCKLYKNSFKRVKKVFFLNNEDKTEFLSRKILKKEQCEIVHGIGVNLEYFAYKPIKTDRTFLMVARMLKTKGVYEYCKCARTVKQKYPDAVFNYLGAEGTVKLSDIQEYIDDGSINYLGTTKDVRPYLEECTAFVLPSYREGMSMSIMEAAATGRAVLATDTVGCRDSIINEYIQYCKP